MPRRAESQSNDLQKHTEPCRGCGNPLYSYKAKYESGCGWPSFNKCFTNSIKTKIQHTIQVEILCKKCNGHLGHVFRQKYYGDPEYKQQRHCVNSLSIKYIKKDIPKELKIHKEQPLDLIFMKGTWR